MKTKRSMHRHQCIMEAALTMRLYFAGLNVVLISRTQQKLDEAATDISRKYKVETKVVSADLSQPGEEQWARIGSVVSQLDVGLLVNNAGRSYDHAEYLDAVDEESINAIIEINIRSINKVRGVET